MDVAAPGSAEEAYFVAQGFLNDGSKIIDPITGQPTPFRFSGDPMTGSGFIDDRKYCGDRWMHLSSGSFNMAPGDSQEVIGAYVVGQSYDALHGVAAVKAAAGHATMLYHNNFNFDRYETKPVEKPPAQFRLSQPYPNPFNQHVSIDIELPRDCDVSLKIYDAAGRFIKQLHNGQMSAGTYRYTWDGKNHLGSAVSSGVYFVRFVAPGVHGLQKLVLIR